MKYLQHFNPARTPQTEQASAKQVPNSAGGFSFAVDNWKRLERFVILGSEGGSYYASEKTLTRESAAAVLACCAEDGPRAVSSVVEISDSGRAPKNDAAIFALALAATHDNPSAREAALSALPRVCRTGTHLFQFVSQVDQMRGWGRALRRGVSNWYTSKTQADLAFQVCKYQNREGWSHADVLARCHARSLDLNPVLRWIVAGINGGGERAHYSREMQLFREYPDPGPLPEFLIDFEELKHADEKRTIQLIQKHGYTHEMIATEHKNSAAVWESLLPRMGMTALIRNLGKLTEVGLLKPLSAAARTVSERLQDREALRKGRVHPIQMLSALSVYAQGHGERGSLTWVPVSTVTDALNEGFYQSFGVIQPSGKRHMLALDVSGSMTCGRIAGVPGLTPRTASACMAMVTARVEKEWEVYGFSDRFIKLDISPTRRLDEICHYMNRLPFSSTNCSLPIQFASQQKMEVDLFSVYTDSETYAGNEHPHQSLRRYRQNMGIPARMAVIGMVSNGFTIADPDDAGMLDVVGFDTATPALLSAFARGDL